MARRVAEEVILGREQSEPEIDRSTSEIDAVVANGSGARENADSNRFGKPRREEDAAAFEELEEASANPREEDLPFQLEAELVDAATRLVDDRSRFEQLLASAHEGRERVSPTIYERVTGDYEQRLGSIEEEYAPIRERVLDHVRLVMKEEHGVRARLEEINEEVEELRFRRQLGEFDDDEFDERRQESTGELTDLDAKLNAIETLYRTVRALLGRDATPIFDGGDPSSSLPGLVTGPQPIVSPPLSSGPAFEQTAVLSTIPAGASQNQTVIVASPGGSHLEMVGAEGIPDSVLVTPLTNDVEKPVRLADRELVLGRSTTCDVVLQGATVSRRHALLRRTEGGFEVEDISSGGGVEVNGQRIEKLHRVGVGDQLQIGSAILRIDA